VETSHITHDNILTAKLGLSGSTDEAEAPEVLRRFSVFHKLMFINAWSEKSDSTDFAGAPESRPLEQRHRGRVLRKRVRAWS